MNLYEYLAAMVGCYSAMPEKDKESLHIWEKQYVDGSGKYATSDWPGWEKYIGKKPEPESKEIDRFGYVYLVQLSSGECKIGKTRNVENRISALQTANPDEISLLHTFPASDALKAEAALHKEFINRKIKNEWFLLNEEEIARVREIHSYTEGVWQRIRESK